MLFLVSLCFLATGGYVLGECSGGCKEPTLLYEDLNCKPLFAAPDDCCPLEYDCSHIETRAAANEEKCYFHGKTYNAGERLNDDDTYENCNVGCFCRKKHSGNMGFTCAVLECPEWFGPGFPHECHLAYELDKCCSVGTACPPFNATCEVDGRRWLNGQQFDDPNVKCMKCVCQEAFAGKFEAPFCKKQVCMEEIERQVEIKNFCAPSYRTLDACCPRNWICPEQSDKIVPAATPSNNPILKCKFGTHNLNIGDKFERTTDNGGKLSCECRIPPYLTCIQNHSYPVFDAES